MFGKVVKALLNTEWKEAREQQAEQQAAQEREQPYAGDEVTAGKGTRYLVVKEEGDNLTVVTEDGTVLHKQAGAIKRTGNQQGELGVIGKWDKALSKWLGKS